MDGNSQTPILNLAGLQAGQVIKVTVNFFAREGSFYYVVSSNNPNFVALNPTQGIFEDPEGWESCLLVALFEVQGNGEQEGSFMVEFNKGDLSGTGTLSNFTILAEVLS
ncbi:MAG: hypothetical protein NZ750_04865 [Anaerolineae bacterium]|nr:hypothetical protein [Anaerolineae bacterium]MDW8173791.1 hypothetical protein [Anaerolineae bacterium]